MRFFFIIKHNINLWVGPDKTEWYHSGILSDPVEDFRGEFY